MATARAARPPPTLKLAAQAGRGWPSAATPRPLMAGPPRPCAVGLSPAPASPTTAPSSPPTWTTSR
eukprot:4213609-Lingulodinium_polyedra.AAC.1